LIAAVNDRPRERHWHWASAGRGIVAGAETDGASDFFPNANSVCTIQVADDADFDGQNVRSASSKKVLIWRRSHFDTVHCHIGHHRIV
jgi:hypothetical protein